MSLKNRKFLFRSQLFLLAAVLFFSCGEKVEFSLETDYLTLGLNNRGNIVSMQEKVSGKEYFPKGQSSPMLSLYKDSVYTAPEKAVYDPQKQSITLQYEGGITATIGVQNKKQYLRFELLSLSPRNGTQAVVWGPYPTTIGELIGETVGVVRDTAFAIGLQALNINTIEGIPDDGDNAGGGSFIDPLPGQTLPDSLKDKIGQPVSTDVNRDGDMPEYVRMYRGSLAVKKEFGSELRMFARDRRIARTLGSGDRIQYVPPVESDFAGSAIAFFGCPAAETLNVIEKIELGEGLPHPMIDGVWIKRAPRTSEAYMMYEGNNMENCLKYAKMADFRLVHIGDVFESWGHFGLKTARFPNGAADIKRLTAKAKAAGISLGVHTLTTFTGTGDKYVSPIPSDSLCKTGSSILAKDITADDQTINVKDPTFFRNTGATHTIKIGKELISYQAVSEDKPWRLLNCVRGQFNTGKAVHTAGVVVDKLANNSYSGFLPDIYLQDQYARRLAEVCRETGIDLMDFDGFEGLEATGHGTYGENKFIDLWNKNLDRSRLVCGSNTGHYFWHIYSYMNWGEPWYSGLRQSQINYRIENQRYFERNYMPGMLGWFKLEGEYRPEEIEWIQARSAAFNAGYLLRVDETVEKSGFKADFFEAIREWQKARNTKAFTSAQIAAFKDPKKEFHLKKRTDTSWELYPVSLQSGFVHQFRSVQTGEPVASNFKINNPYAEQPLQLYITTTAVDGNKTDAVSKLRLEINKYQVLEINEPIKAGSKFIIDGKSVFLCDATWNKLKEIKVSALPRWSKGGNEIVVKSEFSGEQAPVLNFDFKSVGQAEIVKGK
ncbi:hypothetical protein [Dyadobacter bucti]|uniref:hypothetical protein n=1 Tax=Dyadobacter bucti TaxID=2572203 RepID=UPI0011095DD9|nr:hypothetical protein [Dyadobacter bucti]